MTGFNGIFSKARCRGAAIVGGALFALAMFVTPQQAMAQAACNADASVGLNPGIGPIGTVDTVDMTLEATKVEVGGVFSQTLEIDRARYELDCTNATQGAGCTSDGTAMSYFDLQIVDSDCTTATGGGGDTVRWSIRAADGGSGHVSGTAVPNTLEFVPVRETLGDGLGNDDGICETGEPCDAVVVQMQGESADGAGDGESCSFDFDVKVTAVSGDATLIFIEAAGGLWPIAAGGPDATCPGNGLSAFGVGTVAHELEFNCEVELDKQVSCDGGDTWFDVSIAQADTGAPDDPGNASTLSTACIGWNAFNNGTVDNGPVETPAEPILVRWIVNNTGDLDLICEGDLDNIPQGLFDNNPLLLVGGEQTTILVDGGRVFNESPLCSDALDEFEPDTATLDCFCNLNQVFFAEADDTDSALFECQTPGLGVSKTCAPRDTDTLENAIEVSTDTAGGDATLINCTLTDIVFAGACEGNLFDTPVETVADGVPIDVPAANVPFLATTLTEEEDSCDGAICCNRATVTCDIEGSGDLQSDTEGLKQISGTDTADCSIPGEGCFTRTPGYWGTHPNAQDFVYAGPAVFSCGVELVTSDAITEGSGTEDICSIGGGKKTGGDQNALSNTQRQLERQCAAANLNLAASSILDVTCESESPGINDLVANCCNNEDSVCNDGPNGLGVSECIGLLDTFNNLPSGGIDDTNIVDGKAQPNECRQAKKSGFLNDRNRP